MTRLAHAVLVVLAVISPTLAAPSRASEDFLDQYTVTYAFRLGRPTSVRIAPGGEVVYFLRSGPRSFVQDLWAFDVATGRERVVVTAERLIGEASETLSADEKARRERMRLATRGIATYTVSEDGTKLLVPLSGRVFLVDAATGTPRELPTTPHGFPIDPRLSPDGRRLAYVVDGTLFVSDVGTGAASRVSPEASDTVSYGTSEFVAQEEMDRFEGYWWSPDSSRIAYQRSDATGVELFHLAQPADPTQAPDAWPYPRPGKKNVEVRLFVATLGPSRSPADPPSTVEVLWDRARYPYLATVKWSARSKAPMTVVVQNREQTEEVVLAVDDTTGKTTALLTETDDAWLNLDQSVPVWLDDASAFLWTTERKGAWEIELRGRDGAELRTILEPSFGLQELVGLDAKTGTMLVLAGEDATVTKVWRVPLDPGGGKPECLTPARGRHDAVMEPGAGTIVLVEEPFDGPARWSVLRRDGTPAGALRSVAEEPPFLPNPELTRVGTDPWSHAVVIRPRDFVAGRTYPTLLSVYGGPHANEVSASRTAYLLEQWMADRGFVVVALDGRGTPKRGRAWERAIKGNLIDLPLRDQVEGLKLLAARYPEIDLARVGIYGRSFGGYFSAMAAARRPDLFRAAVAVAPVVDWLDYDTHYTERYMGLPESNPEGYRAASVLTYAKNLRVPLLIVHGTVDDNVYFLHSLRLTEALLEAGREFEFVPLSGVTHMVSDPAIRRALETRIVGFFKRHLGRNGRAVSGGETHGRSGREFHNKRLVSISTRE